MLYDELIDYLQNLIQRKITQQDVGEALSITKQAIGNKKTDNYDFKNFEVERIKKYITGKYNVQMLSKIDSSLSEIIKIPYWAGIPEELKHPEYTHVVAQRISIEQGWQVRSKDLCIIPMVGTSMERYWYPMKDGDILIIDTSHNFIRGKNVYFATSRNNTRFWVREMQVLVNDDVEFGAFAPSGNTTRVLNKQELESVGFQVIGRVIKNVSFRI